MAMSRPEPRAVLWESSEIVKRWQPEMSAQCPLLPTQVFLFAMIRGIPTTVNVMAMVFVAPHQDYTCKTPPGWLALEGQCSMKPLNASNASDAMPCTEWDYDHSVYAGTTIIEEVNGDTQKFSSSVSRIPTTAQWFQAVVNLRDLPHSGTLYAIRDGSSRRPRVFSSLASCLGRFYSRTSLIGKPSFTEIVVNALLRTKSK